MATARPPRIVSLLLHRLVLSLLALLLLGSIPAVAAEGEVQDIVHALSQRYGGGAGVVGKLWETAESPLGTVGPREVNFVVAPPGRLLWSYGEEERYVVQGGRMLWFQASQRRVVSAPVPPGMLARYLGFLTEPSKMGKSFLVSLGEPEGDLAVLKLTPRKEMGYQGVVLFLAPGGVLKRVVLELGEGQRTRLEMEELRANSGIKAKLFDTSIPEGWEQVRMEDVN